MSFRLFSAMNSCVTLAPKSQPAPRGLVDHVSTSSGSDHTRSQNAPVGRAEITERLLRKGKVGTQVIGHITLLGERIEQGQRSQMTERSWREDRAKIR